MKLTIDRAIHNYMNFRSGICKEFRNYGPDLSFEVGIFRKFRYGALARHRAVLICFALLFTAIHAQNGGKKGNKQDPKNTDTYEAQAYAELESSLNTKQKDLIKAWRADAESAGKYGNDVRVEADGVDREDLKQLEDLYAKAFAWISGTPEDNEIIPIGQPAQFFGFVSIRHKSGHAASRGEIAKEFYGMLNSEQQSYINKAVEIQMPVVRQFLEKRHLFLNQLASLRASRDKFDSKTVHRLSLEMGRLEVEVGRIEAEAYRKIRVSMTEDQLHAAMKMRGEYIIDDSQVVTMDMAQRGATLSILCSGCHGMPGMHRQGMPGPSLDGFWDRSIASGNGFDYSTAMKSVRNSRGPNWTPELLDQYLAGPKKFAPGTKMEFQGFLNPDDRKAVIEHLRSTR